MFCTIWMTPLEPRSIRHFWWPCLHLCALPIWYQQAQQHGHHATYSSQAPALKKNSVSKSSNSKMTLFKERYTQSYGKLNFKRKMNIEAGGLGSNSFCSLSTVSYNLLKKKKKKFTYGSFLFIIRVHYFIQNLKSRPCENNRDVR